MSKTLQDLPTCNGKYQHIDWKCLQIQAWNKVGSYMWQIQLYLLLEMCETKLPGLSRMWGKTSRWFNGRFSVHRYYPKRNTVHEPAGRYITQPGLNVSLSFLLYLLQYTCICVTRIACILKNIAVTFTVIFLILVLCKWLSWNKIYIPQI